MALLFMVMLPTAPATRDEIGISIGTELRVGDVGSPRITWSALLW